MPKTEPTTSGKARFDECPFARALSISKDCGINVFDRDEQTSNLVPIPAVGLFDPYPL